MSRVLRLLQVGDDVDLEQVWGHIATTFVIQGLRPQRTLPTASEDDPTALLPALYGSTWSLPDVGNALPTI